MQTNFGSTNQMVRLVLTAAFLSPATLAAADFPRAADLVDRPAERRMVVAIGAVDSVSGVRIGRFEAGSLVVRVPRTVTLHRFRVELMDAAGNPMHARSEWGVTVFTLASAEFEALARLSTANAELRMPRPYGVRIAAEDSLMIVANLDAFGSEEGAYLQLTLEYESSEAAISRLPVIAHSTVAAGDVTSSWTWQVAVEGRLVAVSARPFACADELLLEDATTGAVLWRMRAVSAVPSAVARQQSEVIRPGVVLEAGRVYRIRAVYADASTQCGSGTPVAIIVPGARAER